MSKWTKYLRKRWITRKTTSLSGCGVFYKTYHRKENWVHFQSEYIKTGQSTACGKTAIRINKTTGENGVTCRRCIEEMKKSRYWCNSHGFVSGHDVTFAERCDYCGEKVNLKPYLEKE